MHSINPIDKIKTGEELKIICDSERRRDRRIVFTNGCFDLLHTGHVRYLSAAGNLGDILIVAVNSDSSINRIKGPLRPVQSEADRSEIISALCCVDFVTIFDTPDPLPLIELLKPNVLVKGADWPIEKIVGASTVQSYGGSVVRIPLTPQTSTTIIIETILERFGKEARGA
ncbi:MAG: D-glycero-beta-D-manno-heptose 1-phosphate adenylyltransferase [Syntrophobacteraceae bacterium]